MEPTPITPIGWISSPYTEKFGVPREVPQAIGWVHFRQDYRLESAFRELSGFSHIWLLFQFHQAQKKSGSRLCVHLA